MTEQSDRLCEFKNDRLLLRMQQTLPCDVEAISPVVDHVMEIVADMKCAAGKELEVETALREALANAIIHGCKNNPEMDVQVCVACDEARGMLILVRHPGEGFDPASIPSPIFEQNIYSAHGRGIFLINTLMDEVRYERGGTEIIMRKK